MTPSRAVRDLDNTKASILKVATEHFTKFGYHGARVDSIAEQTLTTKRMIYYCFGNKDGLFSACLHREYAKIREFEDSLNLTGLEPTAAIDTYVRETIRYHEAHVELAQLVRSENLLEASHLNQDEVAANQAIVDTLSTVLDQGRATGEFLADATGVEVHIAVTSLAVYRITNKHTVQALFGFDTRAPGRLDHDLDEYSAMMLGWLKTPTKTTPAEPRLAGQPETATPLDGQG